VLLVVCPSRANRPDLRAASRALEAALPGLLAVRLLDHQPPHVGCLVPTPTGAVVRSLCGKLAHVLGAHPSVTALMALAPGDHTPSAYHDHYARARDVASLAGELYAGGIVDPAVVELLTVLTPDPARLRAFARRVCGALLAEPPERLADLMSCALAYYATGQSVVLAAHELGVDRQTVRRRLGKVEQLTGRRVDRDHLALSIALNLSRAALPGEIAP
jgi:hypothetical protein